jgi:hypothetical protein
MSKPTRNRFVNFTPPAPDKDQVYKSHGNLPFSALVTHVWGDRMVNLMVFMPNGDFKPYTSVTLLQGDETEDQLKVLKKHGRFAEWPVVVYPTQTLKVGLEVDTSKIMEGIRCDQALLAQSAKEEEAALAKLQAKAE